MTACSFKRKLAKPVLLERFDVLAHDPAFCLEDPDSGCGQPRKSVSSDSTHHEHIDTLTMQGLYRMTMVMGMLFIVINDRFGLPVGEIVHDEMWGGAEMGIGETLIPSVPRRPRRIAVRSVKWRKTAGLKFMIEP